MSGVEVASAEEWFRQTQKKLDLLSRRTGGGAAVGPATEESAGIVQLATEEEAIAGEDEEKVITPATLAAALAGGASVPDASTTTKGKVELATNTEAATGTDDTRAVTPANLPTAVPAHVPAASSTTQGKVELATDAEAVTGTDTARAITPANLAAAAATHVPAATTSVQGKIEIATDVEVAAGVDTSRAVTPATLRTEILAQLATLPVYSEATETTLGLIELATENEAITIADLTRAMTPVLTAMQTDMLNARVKSFEYYGGGHGKTAEQNTQALLDAIEDSKTYPGYSLGGFKLQLPPGTLIFEPVEGGIDIDSALLIEGHGSRVTEMRIDSTTETFLRFSASNSGMHDVWVDTVFPNRTAGTLIQLHANVVSLIDINVRHYWKGIEVGRWDDETPENRILSVFPHISGLEMYSGEAAAGGGAISMQYYAGANIDTVLITGPNRDTEDPEETPQPAYGFQQHVGDCLMANGLNITNHGRAHDFTTPTYGFSSATSIANSYFDRGGQMISTGEVSSVEYRNAGPIIHVQYANSWFGGSWERSGFFVNPEANRVEDILFSNCMFLANGQSGVCIANDMTKNVSFTGCTFSGNGLAGIQIAGDVENIVVTGGINGEIFDTGNAYGILIGESVTVTDMAITGGIYKGNTLANLQHDGTGDILIAGAIGLTNSYATTDYVDAEVLAVATPDASTTTKGKIEIATNTEALTGTDNDRALVPSALKHVLDNRTASASGTGLVELATNAEWEAGTDATRAVTPANFAEPLTWIQPTLLASFTNFGAGWSQVEYAVRHGILYCHGMVNIPGGATTPTIIFNFPVGARIVDTQPLPAVANNSGTGAAIRVLSNGDFAVYFPAGATWIAWDFMRPLA